MGLKQGLKTADFAAPSALPAHKTQPLSLNQGLIFIQSSFNLSNRNQKLPTTTKGLYAD